ncbi:UNKNOWN [Stylonychia lemnae]|uniref:Uncharacterized protein n=1 Tax=Stylonychia lemnae TaxID=5949 RepID=A0A078AAH0_STYLE|nr:UNKNOWN [Stylonychia lemnae]|eukprot:CDW78861.1 UNKNOWN [Stylonychia lemnae]
MIINQDDKHNGTPMISRAGLSTIPQHLCFQLSRADKRGLKNQDAKQLKLYNYDDDQLDLTAFKREYEEIQEKQMKLVHDKEEKRINVKNSVIGHQFVHKPFEEIPKLKGVIRSKSTISRERPQTAMCKRAVNFTNESYMNSSLLNVHSTIENCKHSRKLSQPQGPHEQRFVSFNTINTHCTKYIDPSQYPTFDKVLSRQQLVEREQRLQNDACFLQDYDPDYEKVMTKISVNIPDFNKQQGRLQSVQQNQQANINSIDPVVLENSYKLLSHVKKDITFMIDKNRGRNEEQGGIYPIKDKDYLLKKQYDSFAKAFQQAAANSIIKQQWHDSRHSKFSKQHSSVVKEDSSLGSRSRDYSTNSINIVNQQISNNNSVSRQMTNQKESMSQLRQLQIQQFNDYTFDNSSQKILSKAQKIMKTSKKLERFNLIESKFKKSAKRH